ncbi:MAG: hypothetical protein JST87_05435 [Bacteroidetes bacterium]|nr:hypothetical protein [Bacteroidota bacterium]
MSKIFMPELSAEERKRILEENCDSREATKYLKQLTPDELDQRREQVTDNAIQLGELEEEKKEAMAEFKSKIDPLVKQNKFILREIKTRQSEVSGILYHMANHEEGMMETYDESGEMIASRRLRPEEKQQKLFSISKTAN